MGGLKKKVGLEDLLLYIQNVFVRRNIMSL